MFILHHWYNYPIDNWLPMTHIAYRMRVTFANKHLSLIQTKEAHELGLPLAVIKSCRDKINFIEQAATELSLRNMRSLDYKKLQGSELRQVKLNDQYRMQFELDNATSPPTVLITFIGDPH